MLAGILLTQNDTNSQINSDVCKAQCVYKTRLYTVMIIQQRNPNGSSSEKHYLTFSAFTTSLNPGVLSSAQADI